MNMMRYFYALLLSAMSLTAFSQTNVTLIGSWSDFSGPVSNLTRVVITPLGLRPVNFGVPLLKRPILMTAANTPSLTDGVFTNSLMAGAVYQISVSDGYDTYIQTNSFETNLAGSTVTTHTGQGYSQGYLTDGTLTFSYQNFYNTNITISTGGNTNGGTPILPSPTISVTVVGPSNQLAVVPGVVLNNTATNAQTAATLTGDISNASAYSSAVNVTGWGIGGTNFNIAGLEGINFTAAGDVQSASKGAASYWLASHRGYAKIHGTNGGLNIYPDYIGVDLPMTNITASGAFSGALSGNASSATEANHATNADNATSATTATSANAVASGVTNAWNASATAAALSLSNNLPLLAGGTNVTIRTLNGTNFIDAAGGAQTNILLGNVLNAGTAAYSNAAAFLTPAQGATTNQFAATNASGVNLSGTFTGNGSALTNLNAVLSGTNVLRVSPTGVNATYRTNWPYANLYVAVSNALPGDTVIVDPNPSGYYEGKNTLGTVANITIIAPAGWRKTKILWNGTGTNIAGWEYVFYITVGNNGHVQGLNIVDTNRTTQLSAIIGMGTNTSLATNFVCRECRVQGSGDTLYFVSDHGCTNILFDNIDLDTLVDGISIDRTNASSVLMQNSRLNWTQGSASSGGRIVKAVFGSITLNNCVLTYRGAPTYSSSAVGIIGNSNVLSTVLNGCLFDCTSPAFDVNISGTGIALNNCSRIDGQQLMVGDLSGNPPQYVVNSAPLRSTSIQVANSDNISGAIGESLGSYYIQSALNGTGALIVTNGGQLGISFPSSLVFDPYDNIFSSSLPFSGDGSFLTNLSAANIAAGGTSTSNKWVGSFSGNITGSGVAILATNRLTFSSVSGLTNTLGRDANAIVSAGTSVVITDTNGNAIATLGTVATLDLVVPMHVNQRLTGTGVSAILY